MVISLQCTNAVHTPEEIPSKSFNFHTFFRVIYVCGQMRIKHNCKWWIELLYHPILYIYSIKHSVCGKIIWWYENLIWKKIIHSLSFSLLNPHFNILSLILSLSLSHWSKWLISISLFMHARHRVSTCLRVLFLT